jgi:hypothetical protein
MASQMDLVRDLLDVQLVDQNKRKIGRVDGVLIEVRDGAPPLVVAMEVGPLTLLRRLHPALARWLRALAVRWLPVSLRSVQLPLTLFQDVGEDIQLRIDAKADRRQLRFEKWLSRTVVGPMPGSRKQQ